MLLDVYVLRNEFDTSDILNGNFKCFLIPKEISCYGNSSSASNRQVPFEVVREKVKAPDYEYVACLFAASVDKVEPGFEIFGLDINRNDKEVSLSMHCAFDETEVKLTNQEWPLYYLTQELDCYKAEGLIIEKESAEFSKEYSLPYYVQHSLSDWFIAPMYSALDMLKDPKYKRFFKKYRNIKKAIKREKHNESFLIFHFNYDKDL